MGSLYLFKNFSTVIDVPSRCSHRPIRLGDRGFTHALFTRDKLCAMFANRNQALSEYKHSLTFRVRCCVVIATKHVHRLQIRPIVHNQRAPPTIPSSYIRVRAVSSMGLRRGTDKHTDDRDQYTFLPRLRLTRNVINRIFVNKQPDAYTSY